MPAKGPIGPTVPNPGHAKTLRARGSSMRAPFDARGAYMTGSTDLIASDEFLSKPVSKENHSVGSSTKPGRPKAAMTSCD